MLQLLAAFPSFEGMPGILAETTGTVQVPLRASVPRGIVFGEVASREVEG
jgi:hypothetical protein